MKRQLYKRIAFGVSAGILLAGSAQAQDIKGGEISITGVGGYTIQANLSLYVKTSLDQGHANVTLDFGDGTQVAVSNTGIINLPYDTRLYTYTATHTYSGSATYILMALDSFWMPGMANISNSSSELLSLRADYTVNPFTGPNSTPVLTNYQSSLVYSAGQILHNPGAVDPDGDVLVYSLIPCITTNYTFPNATINSVTGDFAMPVANQNNPYAVAIAIQEWRTIANTPVNIATTIRNMTIEVPLIISVGELLPAGSLNIFPNPFAEETVIEFSKPLVNDATFIIYDAAGREVKRELVSGEKFTLQRNGISPGVYFYCLQDDHGITARGKLVIQ